MSTEKWYERHCGCDNGDNKPHGVGCPWYHLDQARMAAWNAHDRKTLTELQSLNPDTFNASRAYPRCYCATPDCGCQCNECRCNPTLRNGHARPTWKHKLVTERPDGWSDALGCVPRKRATP